MTQLLPMFGEPIADPRGAAAALRLPAAAVAGTGPAGAGRVVRRAVSLRAAGDAARRGQRGARRRRPTTTFRRAAGVDERAGLPVLARAGATTRRPCTAACSRPASASRKIRPPAARAAPLGCYLVRHKVVPRRKAGAMLSLQGVKMGRPSHMHIVDRRRATARSRACASAASRCSPVRARFTVTVGRLVSARLAGRLEREEPMTSTAGDSGVVDALPLVGATAAAQVDPSSADRQAAESGGAHRAGAGDVQGELRHEQGRVRHRR